MSRTSPPLGNYSYGNFKGYGPMQFDVHGLNVSNANPVLIQLRIADNKRNLQIQLAPKVCAFAFTCTHARKLTRFDSAFCVAFKSSAFKWILPRLAADSHRKLKSDINGVCLCVRVCKTKQNRRASTPPLAGRSSPMP